MVPAAHAIIGAAKNKDVTTITEPATVYVARLACYSYTLLALFMSSPAGACGVQPAALPR